MTGICVRGRGSRAVKGTIDVIKSVACQDGICAIISDIGVCAEGLSMATSFLPGPNVTLVITVLISVSCKFFVFCCKRAKKSASGLLISYTFKSIFLRSFFKSWYFGGALISDSSM